MNTIDQPFHNARYYYKSAKEKKREEEIGKIARMDEYFVKRKKGGRKGRKGKTKSRYVRVFLVEIMGPGKLQE